MARLTSWAAMVLLCSPASAQDLSGIWKIEQPVTVLKTIDGRVPPLNRGAMRIYNDRMSQFGRGVFGYDPAQTCRPIGEPRATIEGMPFEIVQTPSTVVFAYQWNRLNHVLYTDISHPLTIQTYFGSGPLRWDGHTLTLSLSMFYSNTLLDAAGMPHSDALRLTESYRLSKDPDSLIETIHFDDPATFTRPWSAQVTYKRQKQVRLDEDVCEERMHLFPAESR